MNNDFVKKGYNKVAERYSVNRNLFENDKYLKKINSLLTPNSLILDIGCGAGKPIDIYFIKKGHKVIGIDISEEMIKIAKKNVPEGDFSVRDMSDLNEGEYHVDAVVSYYAIFHIPRETHQAFFEKVSSFLPKNGLLLVSMGGSEWEGKEDFIGTEMFWSHYGPTKNRKLVEKAGFTILVDEIDDTGNEKHQIIIAKKL